MIFRSVRKLATPIVVICPWGIKILFCSLKILFKFAERIFGINNCYFNFLNSICINNSTCRSSCSAWSATKVPFFFLLKRLRLLLTSLGSLELCRNEFLSLLSIYYKKKLEQSQTVCLYFREKNRTQADVIIVILIRFFFDFLYLTIWWWEPKVEQTRTESGSQFLFLIFLWEQQHNFEPILKENEQFQSNN